MALCNNVLGCVRLTLVLLWICIQGAGCDTLYQAEEGEFSAITVAVRVHIPVEQGWQEVFQEKIRQLTLIFIQWKLQLQSEKK